MKRSLPWISVALAAIFVFISCQKKLTEVDKNAKTATDFKTFVQEKGFVVDSFYSDTPIDYITTDAEVRQETNLNKYIYPHIMDDRNFLSANGDLMIYQNENRTGVNDSAVLMRKWAIGSNKSYVYMDFVNYDYEQKRYRLLEFTNDHFILYLDWPTGGRIYSRFVLKH